MILYDLILFSMIFPQTVYLWGLLLQHRCAHGLAHAWLCLAAGEPGHIRLSVMTDDEGDQIDVRSCS